MQKNDKKTHSFLTESARFSLKTCNFVPFTYAPT